MAPRRRGGARGRAPPPPPRGPPPPPPPRGRVDRQLAELDTDLVGLDNADAVEQALDHLQQRG
ncbi:hypothetical protein I5K76_27140, partial [Pseudomonas aeruginosa]|nr:hypothetical protein [Pseudomonas aeruginosa]